MSLRNPVVSLAALIVLVGGTGVATAATGGTFLLGRSNSAGARTGLTNTAGTPLSLYAKTGYPPLAVNSEVKVSKLNADRIDGLDSASLQRRVTGTCPGGAVSAVASNGTVTCATAPTKFSVSGGWGPSAAPVDTAIATVGGVTFHVRCKVVEEFEGPRLFMTGYFTGSGIANGHTVTTLYSDVDSVDPVGNAIPAGGTGASLKEIDAPGTQFSRQTAVVMVAVGSAVSQWTLHLFADARDIGSVSSKPCTVWGTVV
ncbi:MAG TPA: hypothetical protein VNQ77_13005 [Frankiaceae bacterium]|nr:hypothetical protein [Frankiaceae bacterium]